MTVVGEDRVGYRLRAYGAHLGRFPSLWRGIGADAARVQRTWWATKGHGSWPPLAASTLRAKRGRGSILVRTGLLRSRTTAARHFFSARGFGLSDRARISIPAEVAYGRFHQTGARDASRNWRLPRRRVLAPVSELRPAVRRRARAHARYR